MSSKQYDISMENGRNLIFIYWEYILISRSDEGDCLSEILITFILLH